MLKETNQLLDRLRKIPQDLSLFVEKRIELLTIEVGEKVANILAKSSSIIATGLVVLMGVLFLLLALSFFLSDLLNSNAFGFGIVALLLLIGALVVYLIAPQAIEEKVRKSIEDQITKVKNETKSTEDVKFPIDPNFDAESKENGLIESQITRKASKEAE